MTGRKSIFLRLTIFFTLIFLSGCAGGGGAVTGNEAGSEPINPKEAVDYQKALLRCLKTGGTRVVKIQGALRCF